MCMASDLTYLRLALLLLWWLFIYLSVIDLQHHYSVIKAFFLDILWCFIQEFHLLSNEFIKDFFISSNCWNYCSNREHFMEQIKWSLKVTLQESMLHEEEHPVSAPRLISVLLLQDGHHHVTVSPVNFFTHRNIFFYIPNVAFKQTNFSL